MKNLVFINGTMGVGKTATCRCLQKLLPNCVFLDGDWCWDAVPFIVNDETKVMVLDNIAHLLGNFLRCSAYSNVIFCWVMHEESILNAVVERINAHDYFLHKFTLTCSEDVLKARLEKDVKSGKREGGIIERSIARLQGYTAMATQKIDVSEITPQKAAELINGRIRHE